MEEFFVTLSLCHTASIVDENKKIQRDTLRRAGSSRRASAWSWSKTATRQGDYEYQASSSDEKALLEACQR